MRCLRRALPALLILAGCPDDAEDPAADDSSSGATETTTPTSSSTAPSTTADPTTSDPTTSDPTTSEETTTGVDTTSGESTETGEVEACFDPTLDLSLCDPKSATFSLDSTNEYYPLVVGDAAVLEGMDEDEFIRIERTVLEDTETVAGVETHVLEHVEYVDGEIVEVARNFYVEATDGTVCYFGEDVDNYVDGEVANNAGSWRAGENGAQPGIIMPADPMVDDAYYQEYSAGEALDMGQVESVGTTEMIGDTSYDDVVIIMDWNPLEGCDEGEPKRYVPGIGEADDNGVVLIEFTPGG